MQEHLTPGMLRQMSGVSELPRPADKEAFSRSVQRHYPQGLRARNVGALVLLDVEIDATGAVTGAQAVAPPTGDPHHRAVLVDRDPVSGQETQRAFAGPVHDPAFASAAEAALLDVQFTPAKRDGQAVPFRMRMSIEFSP